MASPLWALVLSENHGLRSSGTIGGVARPLWSADGSPAVLEQALARAAALVPGPRTVTVIGPRQRAAAAALRRTVDPGYVIRQPGDRGTAPGVLLGLAAILDVRPDALVLLVPADHTLRDADQFTLSVRDAVNWVGRGRDELVLFGARPSSSDAGPAWVVPSTAGRGEGPRTLRPVDRLVHGPAADEVRALLGRSALWHSGVIVARAQAIFDLYTRHQPYLAEMLARVVNTPPARRGASLEEEFRVLRPAEFGRDVLSRADTMVVYTWPASIGYIRLSSMERLESPAEHRASASGGGKTPAFAAPRLGAGLT